MRISDWSSDVCSSDLLGIERRFGQPRRLPVLQEFMDADAKPFGVGAAAQGIEFAQPQYLRRIKGEGIAGELVDSGDADPGRPGDARRRRARPFGGRAYARWHVDERKSGV